MLHALSKEVIGRKECQGEYKEESEKVCLFIYRDHDDSFSMKIQFFARIFISFAMGGGLNSNRMS